MPLRKQKVSVLISQGVQTKVDHKVLPTENLTLLENGEFSKLGSIEKRKGFTKVTKTSSGLINYRDDLISRNVSNDTDDDGAQASIYSESASSFLGDKGWSSGFNYSSLPVSRGSSLYQKNPQVAVSLDGKYALVTFVSVDVIRASGDTTTLDGTITKKCSLVDRSTNSVIASDIVIGTNHTDGGCTMRPVWANDKFYIIGEDDGNIRLWTINPADTSIGLRNGNDNLSPAGTLLFTGLAGGGDYPLNLASSYPYLATEAGFDVTVSGDSSFIHMVRTKKTGSTYYFEYGLVRLNETGSSKIAFSSKFTQALTAGTSSAKWFLHRSAIASPGNTNHRMSLAIQDSTKIKVYSFPEEDDGTNLTLRVDLSSGTGATDRFALVDNPSPTIGSYADVDFYMARTTGTNLDRFSAINSGSTSVREVGQLAYLIFAFPHRANNSSVKGPVTLGLAQRSDDILSPLLMASTVLDDPIKVGGISYTGKQYLRERDYLTIDSFETDYCEETLRCSEPGWQAGDIAIPGRVLAAPIATNFNNYFGDLVANSVIKLFDFKDEVYNERCKPSSAMLKDTLYIADNGLHSYDSDKIEPHGIFQRPELRSATALTSGTHGSLTNGKLYSYKGVLEW